MSPRALEHQLWEEVRACREPEKPRQAAPGEIERFHLSESTTWQWAWKCYSSTGPAAGKMCWTQNEGDPAQAGSHWAALHLSVPRHGNNELLRATATASPLPSKSHAKLFCQFQPREEIQGTIAPSLTKLAQNSLAQLAIEDSP